MAVKISIDDAMAVTPNEAAAINAFFSTLPQLKQLYGAPASQPNAAPDPSQDVEPLFNSGEVDSRGYPWDERIHASTQAKNADGTWRNKRGVSKELVEEVEAEFREQLQAAAPEPTDVAQEEISEQERGLRELERLERERIGTPPPPPPAPPSPTAQPEMNFQQFMEYALSKFTVDDVVAAVHGEGLQGIDQLALSPQHIPAVLAHLQALGSGEE